MSHDDATLSPATPSESPSTEARCPFGHGGAGKVAEAVSPLPRKADKVYRQPIGPPPKPVVGWRGNVLSYFRNPIPYLEDARRRFGNVVALVQGGNDTLIYRPIPGLAKQTVFGFGAEINREVLTQPDVFGGGDFRAPDDASWINGSMSSMNGERRVQHRQVLSPAFGREHIRNYYHEMAEEVDRMLAGWEGRQQIEFIHEAYVLAARIASRCFYGQEPDDIEDNLAVTIRDFAGVLLNPMSAIKLKIPGTPYWHLTRLAPQLRERLSRELIRKEKQQYSGNDALSMMMRAQYDSSIRLSEEEILGSAVGLFLAGHDVPANGLIFLAALLSLHPEASARLMKEIDQELGDRQITYEQIFRLPELNRVFDESLRILSPALLIFRQAQADTTLGNFEIAHGTEVLLSPFMTNTDPATFENPRRYRPERWLTIKPSSYEYLPFGFGVRRCLGASFAEIQLKLAITKIFQRYRLVPRAESRMDFKYTIAVQPHGKLLFDLVPQDRRFDAAGANKTIRGDFGKLVEVS